MNSPTPTPVPTVALHHRSSSTVRSTISTPSGRAAPVFGAAIQLTIGVGMAAWLAACGGGAPSPELTPAPPEQASAPTPPSPALATPAGLSVVGPVDLETIPSGPQGDTIRRGRELVMDSHRLMPDNVGNGLNCTNCHINGGTTPKAAPYVGVTDRYPKYRARSGKVDNLEERVNGCMERSMAGKALDPESDEMRAIVAWMTWLSKDVPDGKAVQDIGMPRIQPPAPPDPVRGEALYATKCAACHQPDGQGMFAPDGKTLFPPLWGERSFNIGAGMARLHTAAAFVKWNMPQGQGGTLTDQEAYDLAAFFTVQPRPDLAKKGLDWPKGDKPEDARY